MKKLTILFMAIVLTASLAACDKKGDANRTADGGVQAKVLATVNDVPITEYDMMQILKRIPSDGGMHQGADPNNILQTLIRNELIYQKALELGLDKNPAYRQKLTEVQAQVREFQRQEMSALYRQHVKEKAEVTDAEAQAYFEKNAQKMQTKFHVWQILYRGKYPEIAKDAQDLKNGIPFEKVASRRFPNLPKNVPSPWELGYLSWRQIPPSWQGIIDRLEPGQVSDVIKGENERFWVIKVVDKTVDPKITFSTEKEQIIQVLRQQKIDALSEKMLSEMKTKAKITFPK